MDLIKLKSIFLKIMIGCLVAAGIVAVITVLSGEFNEIFSKSLGTIGIIAVHSLLSFVYIDISEKQNPKKDLTFFTNAMFIIIILSFITSVFGIWGILDGTIIIKLYLTYGVLIFAILHGEVLSKITGNDKNTDNIVYANYAFMLQVVVLLMAVIYLDNADRLGDVFYRILAALGIIDATLTLVAIILNKIYLQKHPKVNPSVFGDLALGAVGVPAGAQTTVPKNA